MDELSIKSLIVDTGKRLYNDKLVDRSWGNTSARVGDFIYITPSGLSYKETKEEDIVKINLLTKETIGNLKPSSEKGIHIYGYQEFSDATFIIHTHQNYGTILGYLSLDEITDEEKMMLGGLSIAKYALPSTSSLAKNVLKEYQKGSHTVLMKNHGVVFVAKSFTEAYERANLLENIGKRIVKIPPLNLEKNEYDATFMKDYKDAIIDNRIEILNVINKKKNLRVVIDDFAQMSPFSIKVIDYNIDKIRKELKHSKIVLVKGFGAIINEENADNREALKDLLFKECLIYLAKGNPKPIPMIDALVMNLVYKNKYSKKYGR